MVCAKLGSNATPSNPRSPDESTVSVTNGVASSASFLITRRLPVCSATKIRPSGAIAIAVGLDMPLAIVVSVNPAGRVAAAVARGDGTASTTSASIAINGSQYAARRDACAADGGSVRHVEGLSAAPRTPHRAGGTRA